MLGIEEWTSEVVFEYDLQDLTVSVAIDDMRKRILPQMERFERNNPEKWTELGVLIFRQASTRGQVLKAMRVKPLANIVLNDD